MHAAVREVTQGNKLTFFKHDGSNGWHGSINCGIPNPCGNRCAIFKPAVLASTDNTVVPPTRVYAVASSVLRRSWLRGDVSCKQEAIVCLTSSVLS